MDLNNIVALIAIFTFICGIMKWAIIDPLNKSINGLTITVAKLETLVDNLQSSENSLDKRLSIVEAIMKRNGCDHDNNVAWRVIESDN